MPRTAKRTRRSGWRQWKPEEALRRLKEWRASGLPLATFARQHGLTEQRLRWWCERLGESLVARPAEAKAHLVPAVVTGVPVATGASALLVHLPGGVVLELADARAVPTDWLVAVVRGLGGRAA